jgi:acyl-CoA thioesterase FadM
MSEPIPAPLSLYAGSALPEWMDYNGHMMDGYYAVAFTFPTDAFLDYLGFGPAYRERTGKTVYTVEGHINFLREVHAGARLRYTTQLLNYDARRLHIFHHMLQEDDGYLAATNELMLLHVNQASLKVESMPPSHLERVEQVFQAHAALARPPQAGRSIGLSKHQRAEP